RSEPSRSSSAPRTRCSCRSGRSSTAISRRSWRPVRDRVRRDDAWLRARLRAHLPGLAHRPHRAALARVPARARLRLGAVAIRPFGRRRGLLVAFGARGLGAPRLRLALGRRADLARVRDLAGGSRPAATLVPAVLEARDGPDRGAPLSRDLPQRAARRARPGPLARRRPP